MDILGGLSNITYKYERLQYWKPMGQAADIYPSVYPVVCLSIPIYISLFILVCTDLGHLGVDVLKINFLHIKSGRFLIIWNFLLLKYQISQY